MKEDWLQWFTICFDKKSAGSGAKSMPNQQLANEFRNKSLGNLKDAKAIFLSKTKFAALILLICN